MTHKNKEPNSEYADLESFFPLLSINSGLKEHIDQSNQKNKSRKKGKHNKKDNFNSKTFF